MAAEPPEPDDLPWRLARLPPGRHGLPREFVAANHRDRLLAACIQVVEESGYADASVARIIKAAAVSRRTFYEHFESREDCFIATYDTVLAHLRARVDVAAEAGSDWAHGIHDALGVMLAFLAAEPALARLLLVEPLVAGPPISEYHRRAVASFAPLLFAGREATDSEDLPEDIEEAVIAGMTALITRRIAAGEAERLGELRPDLTVAALTPYLGAAEAERIARE